MFKHVLAIKNPNVADQLSVDRCLAKGASADNPAPTMNTAAIERIIGVEPGILDDYVRI
jgi:hypothetical protein